MPINPNIALSVEPIQIKSPLAAEKEWAAYQDAQQQRQINAQRLRQETIQTQEAERAQKEAEAARGAIPKLYEQNGKDWGKTYDALATSGIVRPESAQKMKKAWADMNESMAKSDTATVDLHRKRMEALGSALTSVAALPEDQQPAAWGQKRQILTQLGIEAPEQWMGSARAQAEALDALAVKDAADLRLRQAQDQRAATAAADTRASVLAELPGKRADAEAKQAEIDARAVAAAAQQQGPAGMAAAVAALPESRRKYFAGLTAKSTPDQILRMGMTAAQQTTAAAADRAAAEQARHNKQAEDHQRRVEAREALQTKLGLAREQRTAVNQVASQFDNEPMVKNYNTIAEAKNFVDTLGEGKAGNAGDDQALLYAFAKAMDPQSVVREGEYATVQKYSQSWAQTFGFKAERIFSNAPFLSDDARQKMKATVNKKADSAKKSYDNIYSEYGRRIEAQAGVKNGKEFLTDYAKPFAQPNAAPGTVKLKAPDGTTKDVPAAEAEHYIKLGAQRVN